MPKPSVISEKLSSYVFPDKNQKLLRVSRMQITKQAVDTLSPISGSAYTMINHYFFAK